MTVDGVTKTWPYDPAGIIAGTSALMQLPLLAALGWYELLHGMAFSAWPHGEHRHAALHELIVPPPIEDEGEHALFA